MNNLKKEWFTEKIGIDLDKDIIFQKIKDNSINVAKIINIHNKEIVNFEVKQNPFSFLISIFRDNDLSFKLNIFEEKGYIECLIYNYKICFHLQNIDGLNKITLNEAKCLLAIFIFQIIKDQNNKMKSEKFKNDIIVEKNLPNNGIERYIIKKNSFVAFNENNNFVDKDNKTFEYDSIIIPKNLYEKETITKILNILKN